MKVIYSNLGVRQWLGYEGKGVIGFIPTMGALHKGHLSLVEQAKKRCNTVVVSIFVNPTQFNNPQDLKNYPRSIEKDLAILKKLNTNMVYVPKSVNEVYANEDIITIDFDKIDKIMEGSFRKGHFAGVARVVKILLELIKPEFAFFGQKDYQQLLIIRDIVKQFNLKTKIIGCETVREKDGLAMSSRNVLLNTVDRNRAKEIYRVLNYCKRKFKIEAREQLEQKCFDLLKQYSEPEYFEIRNDNNLSKQGDCQTKWRAFVASRVGNVRLIDNIALN